MLVLNGVQWDIEIFPGGKKKPSVISGVMEVEIYSTLCIPEPLAEVVFMKLFLYFFNCVNQEGPMFAPGPMD